MSALTLWMTEELPEDENDLNLPDIDEEEDKEEEDKEEEEEDEEEEDELPVE